MNVLSKSFGFGVSFTKDFFNNIINFFVLLVVNLFCAFKKTLAIFLILTYVVMIAICALFWPVFPYTLGSEVTVRQCQQLVSLILLILLGLGYLVYGIVRAIYGLKLIRERKVAVLELSGSIFKKAARPLIRIPRL